MITLRPYQTKADAEVVEAWRAGKKRVLLQLPTGGGKKAIIFVPSFTKRKEMNSKNSFSKDAAYIFAVVIIIFIIARAIGLFSNLNWP